GSSIGVAVAGTRAELEKAIAGIGAEAPELLVEAFVAGREATCGVLEGAPVALPPTEIRPKRDGFFSFAEKYTQNGADEITPAEVPPAVNDAIRRFAAKAHAALGLSVYSRTDFIWTGGDPENGGLFALETNNLPGMTPKSILPQQAAAIGMSYTDLVKHVTERSPAVSRRVRPPPRPRVRRLRRGARRRRRSGAGARPPGSRQRPRRRARLGRIPVARGGPRPLRPELDRRGCRSRQLHRNPHRPAAGPGTGPATPRAGAWVHQLRSTPPVMRK